MKDAFRAISREWIAKAESDLNYARASFGEFDEFYSQMCIMCHDSAEKYLKAFIAAHGGRPERTHDLVTLLLDCIQLSEEHAGLTGIEHHCRLLNRYYIPLKYPSHYPAMTRKQAEEAIAAAKLIADEISSRLGYR